MPAQKTSITFCSLLSPYRARIAAVLFLMLSANLLALVLPWAIKIIIDDILTGKDADSLNLMMPALVAILGLRSVFGFLRAYLSGSTGERIVCDLRQEICDHIPRLSLTSINKISPAQILTRITQDVNSLRRFLFGDAVEFIYAFLNIGFIAAILSFVNVKLTVLSLSALPLFAVIYFLLIPELKNRHSRLRDMHGVLSSRFSEVLNGIRMVRSFAGNARERQLFETKQRDILSVATRTHYLHSWLWVGIEFFTSLGIIGILWIGGSDVMAGRMTAGELVAFYTYLGMLFSPVIRMVVINASYQEALAALNRINDVMNIDDEVPEAEHSAGPGKIEGRVEFKKVSFHYTAGDPVLKDIHFAAESGETIGIVGASGAGKTTLVSLLLRFFDPDEGEILIDGKKLKDLGLDAYRRQIAVVLQDDFLFSGTVEDNIKYGKPQASREDIVQAARIAQAHPFISELADGYKTEVGERGFNLSCGQRQRIAIARAVIKNPSLLILDEATSSVDALTENDIQRSIRRFMKGKTVFLVAHRFSTVMESDKILVLDKGRIVEAGGHNYLLNKRGFYSSLYLEQFKDEDRASLSQRQ
ncbi:MAG: ABC transporter ATP-binding protein [Candidatus Omnitrophica bacterium]|nr:ABC transporter ATP-binding protein [Candidatus Omnitrophota bacterium]